MKISTVAILALALAPALANASNYPPNYVLDSQCQEQGNVKVCAINQHYGSYPRISVVYNGQLLATQWGRIGARVSFNGRSGLFPMSNANYAESVVIGDLAGVTQCVDASSPSVGRPYPACTGQGSWNFMLPSSAEADLLFYARNDRGAANAWDVSVTFEAQDGSRDTRTSTFRFE